MVTQQTLQFVARGSNPTTPHQFLIRQGEFKDFAHLLDKYHYKKTNIGGSISFHLKLMFNDVVVGGAVLGAMRHKESYSCKATELRRMVLDEICPKNTASYFLSKIIWWLKKNTDVDVVYTFADTTVNHTGTCYKAANFEYVKKTPKSKYVMWKGKRYHCRSLTIDRPYSYRLRDAIKCGDAEILTGSEKILYKYVINKPREVEQ